MPIMAVHHGPSLTREKYEQVVLRLTGGKPAESASDLPFDGLLVHVAGESEDGFWIVDVWESEQAVERFRETIAPIAEEAGIEEPPEFFPVHTFIRR